MRKIFICIAFSFLGLASALAQESFKTDSVFNWHPRSQVTMSVVKGKELKAYNLDYFKSIRFKATDEETTHVLRWLEDDSATAIDDEKVSADGHLVYRLMRFSGQKPSLYQYIGFQQKRIDGEAYLTVVYMKGEATPDDLNKIFKHRKVK